MRPAWTGIMPETASECTNPTPSSTPAFANSGNSRVVSSRFAVGDRCLLWSEIDRVPGEVGVSAYFSGHLRWRLHRRRLSGWKRAPDATQRNSGDSRCSVHYLLAANSCLLCRGDITISVYLAPHRSRLVSPPLVVRLGLPPAHSPTNPPPHPFLGVPASKPHPSSNQGSGRWCCGPTCWAARGPP